MKAKIIPCSVKGNQDGTISLKLDKGADRIELIRLEDIDIRIERFDRAIVQNPDDLVTAEVMELLDRIETLRSKPLADGMIDKLTEEAREKEFAYHPENKVQGTIEKAAEDMPDEVKE